MRIAIVGVGKIARDQHVPAIAATAGLELVATSSLQGRVDGVPCFPSLEALLLDGPAVDAVSLCTPPQVRRAQAALALAAGKHVLLEKPPGVTVAELLPLRDAAREAGRTLFAAWHSRFASGVEPARALLARHGVSRVAIAWKEDVRVWHPGQDWIWQPGGLGVFDPGINALSILTRILPRPVFVTGSELWFPVNRAAPIAAALTLSDGASLDVAAAFDFRQTGPQSWDIAADTPAGPLLLSHGGARLAFAERDVAVGVESEYPSLYRRFAELAVTGASDVDPSPLVHVADAFMLGRRTIVEAFHD